MSRPWAVLRSPTLQRPDPQSTITLAPVDRNLAISPNGSQIVYVGNDSTQVFRWTLDQLEPGAGASV